MNRPRRPHAALAIAAASLCALPAAVTQASGPSQPTSSRHVTVVPAPQRVHRSPARWVVYLTNIRRTDRGLAPLRLVPKPQTAAQRQSGRQAAIDQMTHYGSNGGDAGDRLTHREYPWRLWGENVAAGQQTATAVVKAWMRSPGHRANMLKPDATHIGVNLRYAADGTPYWTMVIADRF